MIRAKFRCLSVSEGLGNSVQIRLAAVIPKKGLPNYEENQQFWKYSPSGEMKLTYNGVPMVVAGDDRSGSVSRRFEVGAFYYIDMEKKDVDKEQPELWSLAERHNWLGGQSKITFRLPWVDPNKPDAPQLRAGEFEIQLSNEAAGAKAQFGDVGHGWQIDVSFAHGPELE
jgi:hypothetical protein